MPGADGAAWTPCLRSPAKLQRDLIADLEAQVEALTAALQEKDGWVPGSSSMNSLSGLSPASASQGDGQSSTGSDTCANSILTFIDRHVSVEGQRRAVNAYSYGFKSVWCPANLSQQTLQDVRRDSPLLLLTILAFPMAAEVCNNSCSKANDLVNGAIDYLGKKVLVEGAHNQEVVRALLTAAFWHRVPRGEVASHCHQYSRLAVDMAIDIGLGGPEFPGSPAAYFRRMDGHQDDNSGRTWLACYAAATMYGLNQRRPATVSWSQQHERNLRSMENNGRIEDRLFCQIIMLIHLCQQAAEKLELCNLTVYLDINDTACQQKMAILADQFEGWKSSVPQDLLAHPMVRFWSCIFDIYLHEVVLHTPTNKSLSAAPHVPPNLPVADFATPQVITDAAAAATSNLITACQGAILACEDMGPAEVLAAPSMIFAPAVMYALKTLVHVFVTVYGPGSTFGTSNLIVKEDICMRQYISKVIALGKAVDSSTYTDTYWTGRILGAASWFETWANDYEVILERYAEKQRSGEA
ncbi:hypothetical protein NLU13_9763 [Sarocladium strictum]|uniref:Uncharacterized protein n=1 Tax=Sarocladium strictum TaxID=5046 RepID=A0AA39L4H9_SARSR|nr:hypothetical protein NLU13_9763 [Sarocladium strictum]